MNILFCVLFVLVICTHCEDQSTYYVKPTVDAECPDQPCEILQQYLDNYTRHPIIGDDITVILLNGTHSIDTWSTPDIHVFFSVLNIVGQDNQNVTIQCSRQDQNCPLTFVLRNSYLSICNLTSVSILDISIIEEDPGTLQLSSVTLHSTKIGVHIMQASFNYVVTYQSFIFSSQAKNINFFESTFSNQSRIQLQDPESKSVFINCTFSTSQLIVVKSNARFYGVSRFENIVDSALKSYQGSITVTGTVLFINNTGTRGAGMSLYYSSLSIDMGANMTFINNSASEKGGAIYIEPSSTLSVFSLNTRNAKEYLECFYGLQNCPMGIGYNLNFMNNFALFGGDDVYGASFNNSGQCRNTEVIFPGCNVTITGASSSISSISSEPTRVCLCDNHGQPQCDKTYMTYQISSGESFTINVVPVGENFGTTSGRVFAYSFNSKSTIIPKLELGGPTLINSKECAQLNYSLHTNRTYVQTVLYLATGYVYLENVLFFKDNHTGLAPVVLNITILPCPPGFLLVGDPPGCECYHNPCDNNVQCIIINGAGLFSWNDSLLWVGNNIENKTTCNEFCPVDYCNITGAWVDIVSNPDTQCAFNRAGRLCGGCKENYSLAIGSSHCIQCPNNNNLALFLFFAPAGILLVLFITALNLTVTQNVINGLIFYANVIWIYQNIFFPKGLEMNALMVFLKTFIAWLNLDFGIETCFAKGLTAFWKQWLQFIFPFYIWCLVGLVIMAARHSTKITRLLPRNRTIPVLATVFLLSYMKLVGITSSALKFSFILEYPNDTIEDPKPSVTAVWSVDGNLDYCGHPHILLFLAGLATLLILWLPYTLVLLLMQWLRRVSHLRFLNWIEQFVPISDAYSAPLKHKHQYWFSVLLLVRGVLLVISTSAFGIPHTINLLILLIFTVVLLFYMNLMHVYKSTGVLLVNSSFIFNLIVLSGFFILTYTQSYRQRMQMIAVGLSTACAFIQFCSIVLYVAIKQCTCILHCSGVKTLNKDGTDDYTALGDVNQE